MRAPIRLEREAPAARQAGCATAIGVLLTVVGGLFWVIAQTVDQSAWLAYVVGVGFSLAGLLMLFFGIKMALMIRLPETVVEVDRMPVRAGQPFQITVRQPGPIRLESLRLNVVGEQLTQRKVWRKGQRRTETDRHLIYQNNVIDIRNLTIAHGAEVTSQAEAMVPAKVTLVDVDGRKTVVWRLEVWGRARGWVNFGHPFVITVSGGANHTQDADSEC